MGALEVVLQYLIPSLDVWTAKRTILALKESTDETDTGIKHAVLANSFSKRSWKGMKRCTKIFGNWRRCLAKRSLKNVILFKKTIVM